VGKLVLFVRYVFYGLFGGEEKIENYWLFIIIGPNEIDAKFSIFQVLSKGFRATPSRIAKNSF
jgi:hypothetical protein